MVVAIIVIAVILLLGLFWILIRNSIIGSRNRVSFMESARAAA